MTCRGLTYRLAVGYGSFTFAFSGRFFVCLWILGYIWALQWETELFPIYSVMPWIYFLRCLYVVFQSYSCRNMSVFFLLLPRPLICPCVVSLFRISLCFLEFLYVSCLIYFSTSCLAVWFALYMCLCVLLSSLRLMFSLFVFPTWPSWIRFYCLFNLISSSLPQFLFYYDS